MPHPKKQSKPSGRFVAAAVSPAFSTKLSGAHHSSRETMYHGTSMLGADSILGHGFKASEHGLLGTGMYLTTDKSKAGRYGPKLLTCSVDVGRKCCIDRRDHPDRDTWPESCDTKWIPDHAVHQWTSQQGDVYCVRDVSRIAIINVQDVRCCPCSIADCRQCFPDQKQQRAQRQRNQKKQQSSEQTSVTMATSIPLPTSKSSKQTSVTMAASIPLPTTFTSQPSSAKASGKPAATKKDSSPLKKPSEPSTKIWVPKSAEGLPGRLSVVAPVGAPVAALGIAHGDILEQAQLAAVLHGSALQAYTSTTVGSATSDDGESCWLARCCIYAVAVAVDWLGVADTQFQHHRWQCDQQ